MISYNAQMENSKCIGHYILGQKIGVGGFAKVKKARHKYTGVDVAVKIINKKVMKAKKMIVKIKREIRIMRYFNHPHVIKLYEVLENTTDIFIVMELAPNGGLFEHIVREGELSQAKARYYFRQIVSGVDYCHQNMVSHRDLKPDNILMSETGSLKIADFGLSNIMKDGKFLKTQCGSLSYASPELLSSKNYEGTCVDIWSLGVTLYVMLTGRFPFQQEHQSLFKNKIINAKYNMPESFSPECKDLISRILVADPSRRIRMDKIRVHPWLREHLPIYATITSSFASHMKSVFIPNEEILNEIMKYDFKFPAVDQPSKKETMFKMIRKKEEYSFVIAYRLLESQYNKTKNKARKSSSDEAITLFQQINNHLEPAKTIPLKIYRYGQPFRTSARTLAKHVIAMLDLLKVAYKAKPQEYRFKCSYRNQTILEERTHVRKDSQQLTMEDAIEEKEPNEDRYSKMEVTFDIQIYGVKADLHILDIYLYNGHPMVFLKYVDVFLRMLRKVTQH